MRCHDRSRGTAGAATSLLVVLLTCSAAAEGIRRPNIVLIVIDILGKIDGPFFLNMCYYTVHTPIEAKPDLVSHYEEKREEGMSHENATYAAMCHSMDENVGRLLNALEERGIADETIAILTSDNGGFINDYQGRRVTNNAPLRSGKGSLHEGGIRVPLIIRWPGVVAEGGLCRTPVVSTDLHPTLCEAAGASIEKETPLDGLSITALLRDPSASLDRDALCFHYPHYYQTTPVSAIRQGDWKLLEYFEDGRLELYDLASDRGEERNLASDMPERAAGLRASLAEWRNTVGAQYPTMKPDARPSTTP